MIKKIETHLRFRNGKLQVEPSKDEWKQVWYEQGITQGKTIFADEVLKLVNKLRDEHEEVKYVYEDLAEEISKLINKGDKDE